MYSPDVNMLQDCPHCGDASLIVRAGILYCADCGWGRTEAKFTTPPIQSVPLKTAKAPEIAREEALSKLSGIISDLQDLSQEFSFEIPQRVLEVLSIAEEVIKGRYE